MNRQFIQNNVIDKYAICLPDDFIEFMSDEKRHMYEHCVFDIDDEKYEIRFFLDYSDIKSLTSVEYFMKNTKKKILPFAKDSFDNYFCINVENSMVYLWDQEEDLYYLLADSFEEILDMIGEQ